jgi:hypothetical protein
MLALMELRGFKVVETMRGFFLVTPDDYTFAVQLFPDVSTIKCVFAAFETLNPQYP